MSTSRDLKVPYAFNDDGQVVVPFAAIQGRHYMCLECGQRLDLRRSRRERPHFAHRPEATKECTGESATHLAAKHLLKAQLEGELAMYGSIAWYVTCAGLGDQPCRDRAMLKQSVPIRDWDAVALEVPHGPYRFDVAVTHQRHVIYGFEVFFKHQVPQAKADALRVPWLELLAEDILEYRPRIPWMPIGAPHQAKRCRSCEELNVQLQKRAQNDQQRSNIQSAFVSEIKRVERAWRMVLEHAKLRGGGSKH